MLERLFELRLCKTDVKTEIMAGITTFMVMAYIIIVNPAVLSAVGMDSDAVLIGTCLATFIGCLLIGLTSNFPIAVSAGMGLSVFFARTVCAGMGFPWQVALLAVLIAGSISFVISLTPVRRMIVDSIPDPLKKAIAVGVGLFLAFIGLQNGGIVVEGVNLVAPVNIREDFHSTGICALLAVIGILLTFFLYFKKVPGALLFGILITWGLGMICQATGLYQINEAVGCYSLYPKWGITDFSSLGSTFGMCFSADLSAVDMVEFITVIVSFVILGYLDAIGTLIGVPAKMDLLHREGRIPSLRAAFASNSLATVSAALMGCSTTSPLAESAAGVGSGGRTGLTAITTGFLFLVAMLFAPVLTSIPSFATAPPLLLVGFLMFSGVTEIRFTGEDWISAVPAYICILTMPILYSISEGISLGIISYVVLHLLTGNIRKCRPMLIVLAVLFAAKYVFV